MGCDIGSDSPAIIDHSLGDSAEETGENPCKILTLLGIQFCMRWNPDIVNQPVQNRREPVTACKWGKRMIRSELIQKIADENPHLYHRDVERIVNAIFEEIIEAMARGDRVELRGFGAFSVKRRDARIGRNPRTGDSVQVDEKHVPFFKTGKLLRDRLNDG